MESKYKQPLIILFLELEKIRVNPICLKGALLTAVMTPISIATKLTKFQKKNKFCFFTVTLGHLEGAGRKRPHPFDSGCI